MAPSNQREKTALAKKMKNIMALPIANPFLPQTKYIIQIAPIPNTVIAKGMFSLLFSPTKN